MRAPALGAIGLAPLLSACVEPGTSATVLAVQDFEVNRAPIETVLLVSWTTATPLRSTVTATFGDDTITVSEDAETDVHAITLVGFPPQTDVTVRVTAEGVEGAAELGASTGALPRWVPDTDHASDDPGLAEGGLTLVPVILPEGGGILGLDHAGRPVWSWPPSDEPFVGSPFRAWLSADRSSVIYNLQAPSAEEDGVISRIGLSGEVTEQIRMQGAHTDFIEHRPGAYLSLGYDIREVEDGRRILGDTIVEKSEDGAERVVWSVWDDFEPDLSRTYDNLYTADLTVEDWSHINGIFYDATTDDVYVTATFNNAVIRVDRSTGDLVWTLADYEGDFTNLDGRDRVQLPHSVQRLENGNLLVFSRGSFHPDSCSAAVELTVDEERMESREVWRYASPDCLAIPYLGSAERLPGGNTMITWTTAGKIDEVTEDGVIGWQAYTPIGAAFGFSTRTVDFP